jgi:hypothetical protein
MLVIGSPAGQVTQKNNSAKRRLVRASGGSELRHQRIDFKDG